MTITMNDYQAAAVATASPNIDATYLAAKLMIEAAEAAQPIIKRNYHGAGLDFTALTEELGDVLWYVAALAHAYNLPLDRIAELNLSKLASRHGAAYNQAHYTGPEPTDSVSAGSPTTQR